MNLTPLIGDKRKHKDYPSIGLVINLEYRSIRWDAPYTEVSYLIVDHDEPHRSLDSCIALQCLDCLDPFYYKT